ncbi:glycosyl hydrolase family 18 protein [Endozoicomonas sp. 4G]|uniref:PKD domain-containing protein n=1 Tax=Endozoicomonas sp. 4G TaxID=2872754 RepID=UPI002078CD03|nr:glycosyl hydrolase family 18 protein [Endozoicomonas sp. 4G]
MISSEKKIIRPKKLARIISMVTLAATVSTPLYALEAWNGQSGSDTYDVIFDGSVYQNQWWVESTHCPAEAAQNPNHNPWRFTRAATKDELAEHGNPTSCDLSSGGGEEDATELPEFDPTVDYKEGDEISYNEIGYVATATITAYSFIPGQENPWQAYAPLPAWSAAVVYNTGDVVEKEGQAYEALFYTQGADPSNPDNQNPDKNNGMPWYPLGQALVFTEEELANAPELETDKTYQANELVKYQDKPYVAQQQVTSVTPDQANPWKLFIDWGNTKAMIGEASQPWPDQVFAPYVDLTLGDIPDFAELAKNQNIKHFTTAFIVAQTPTTCLPSWGGVYPVGEYAQYNNIKSLREAGGDVMPSIGGATNTPLATACTNLDDLATVYYDIVDNMNLKALDFDIEGAAVADPDSIERRSKALKMVQDQWQQEDRQVKIWYTLPVMPTGLTVDGLNVLNSAKEHGVELDGINVMTMNYGSPECRSEGQEGSEIHGRCSVNAINALFKQVKGIFTDKSDEQIWDMLGTTPMIGHNDVDAEVFYLSDAELVYNHAQDKGLGMVGIWSIARDKPGTEDQVAPDHSGLTSEQAKAYAFSEIFSPFGNDSSTTDYVAADAGSDQRVTGPTTVILDGRGSSDPDGDALTYTWTQKAGDPVALKNANTATPSFNVAAVNAGYTFTLSVTDGQYTDEDDVTVTVSSAEQLVVSLNEEYQVNSGGTIEITAEADGGESLIYEWILPANIVFDGQGSPSISVTAPTQSNDSSSPFSVEVSSDDGRSAKANSTLTVKGSGGSTGSCEAIDPEAANYEPWQAQDYEGGSMVSHNNLVWKAAWYANASEEPGVSDTWELYSDVAEPWNTNLSYEQGEQVSHNGIAWTAEYWANPGEEPGVAPVWKEAFVCE